jgi:hypothetical protein
VAWRTGDRVKETTTTTGTGDIALLGAVTGFQAFSGVVANGDVVMYAIVGGTTEWEVGYGTWVTGPTLQRTRVLASSNAGAAVSFSAGTKDVFGDLPAAQGEGPLVNLSPAHDVIVPPGAALIAAGVYAIPDTKMVEIWDDGVLAVL